jgi:tetratricopeptide (TPR) repeat protein
MFSSRTLGLAVALLALTVVVYWPVKEAGIIWDDNSHFLENHAVTSPDGLKAIWTSFVLPVYYPLTFTVFWLIYQLAGPNPLPYHVVTLALHAVNAVLLLFILRRLKVRGAWVVAALWAIHPVNVESVAWATELKNTLSAAGFFASLLCFLRYERELTRKWFAGALLCFAAALLSKSSTVMLPAVLLLFAWWQRGRVVRVDVLRTLPFFALSLTASFVAVWAQVKEKVSEGTGRDWALQLPERLIVTGKDLWFYASKTVCPANLMFIYPRWSHDARRLTEWLPLAGAVAVGIILWRFRRAGAGRATIVALGYFAVALSPVLGFFDQYFYRYSFVADHFQYLASIGLIALACAAIAGIVQAPPLRLAIASAALISCGFLSWQHLPIFADEETLWRDTVTRNPRAVIAQNNLGLVLYGQLQYRRAIECFDRALQANPNSAEAHYNLGLVLTELGQYAQAASQMRSGLQVVPDFAKAENGLGFAMLQLGQSGEATAHLRRALDLDPDYVDAHNNLGKVLLSMGQPTEAEVQFRSAARIHPTDFTAHENLGVILFQQHRLDEATTELREAARLKPDDPEPHKNLADVFATQHRLPEAQQERDLAVSSAERLGETHYRIATALQGDNDLDGAIKHFRKSITFRPNSAETYLSLGKVLAEQSRFAEAIVALRQGADAVPDDLRIRDQLARLLATSR